MNQNESTLDRIVRTLIGAALAFGAINTMGTLSIVMTALSVLMVVTALVGFCPLYRVLGLSTSRLMDQ
ncbi:MAG: DUF2892 domain-containing protein [Cyanobium sp. CZS 25K]|nr:DUF2892 domain-containing protein [Cyanobium sp. CZS25K]